MTTHRTPASDLLDRAGIPYRFYTHAAFRTMEDVVESGYDAATSVKTLAFTVEGRLILAGIPGEARLRYILLTRALGVQRSKLKPATAEDLAAIGMVPGGVCPLTDAAGVQVVLDASIADMPLIHCASGRQESSVELTSADLFRALPHALAADLTSPDPA